MGDIDLAEVRNMCLTNLYSCTDNISKYLQDNKKEKEFDKLRKCVEEYCKLEYLQNSVMKSIMSEDASNMDTLEERLNEISFPNIFHGHSYIIELEKHIKSVEARNKAVENDADLAITEEERSNIDPISKKPIENPVRNRICNHIYEKSTIERLIENKNNGCPYVGCTNKTSIVAEHLVLEGPIQS